MTEKNLISESWLTEYAPQIRTRFWLGLHRYFDAKAIDRTFYRYRLVATLDGRQVFPFYDQDFELRAVFIGCYHTDTLCPDRGQNYAFYHGRAYSGLLLPEGSTPPCLFGAHRLRAAADDAAAFIHTTPRDAVICALADDSGIHLAAPDAAVTADDDTLCRWFEPLRQRRLILCPPIPPRGTPLRKEWRRMEAWLHRNGFDAYTQNYGSTATYTDDGIPCYQHDAGLAEIVLQRLIAQPDSEVEQRLSVFEEMADSARGKSWYLMGKEAPL